MDVPLSQELPELISFRDENGVMVRESLDYEWRPTMYTKCKMIGHVHTAYRQGKLKKVWVKKLTKQIQPPVTEYVTSPVLDPEGFRSLRPVRVRASPGAPVRTSNVFQILETTLTGDAGLEVEKGNGKLYQKFFANWSFTSNSSYHAGGRIVVVWKAGCFNVNIVAASGQFLHCHVTPVSGMLSFYCTFFYAYNDPIMRQELWRDLRLLNTHDPWLLCEDFNCVMAVEERIGAPVRQCDIVDISSCMHTCGMEDIKCVGNFYTWNNKHQGSKRVFSTIYRILANQAWQGCYSTDEVCFMLEGHFDHSPGLLTVYSGIVGSKMFTLVNKLKKVKLALKELNKIAEELRAIQEYSAKHKAYLDFLSQKAKVAWLKDGDESTALFFIKALEAGMCRIKSTPFMI
ncbi:uncharacterized protein [Spinacia oleracea]|uniref:Endonuclease/exonuclease/phosphatase domain-containing protein n=1 Tax=Spinacia oleracea TaxID=3562 RepID=A0ABM3QWF8_SPIOL|nr:uncharacterized protein LOC110781144 [Spinacia oleracea]